ncbi:MAG: lysophospholipid acyltransferase family protein [Thermomicrobiales bacterium]
MATLPGGQGIDLPSRATSEVSQGNRFRPTLWSAMQARRIRLWLALVGKGLLRINLEVEGKDNVPPGEPVIVAAAPHRSWIDPFVLLLALPSLPRLYFLGAADGPGNRWWKRLAIEIAGGMVPVTTRGHLNREALELSLAILANDNRVGIFPEGWGDKPDPEILPLKRGVAFLSEHSGRRVLPVAIAGNLELWRGCTIRVAISPPLPVLAPGADRVAEQAFTDHLRDTLIATMPPAPAAPPPDARPWRWLTRLI